ncbi:unnamed protein product [Camellia sinensis]
MDSTSGKKMGRKSRLSMLIFKDGCGLLCLLLFVILGKTLKNTMPIILGDKESTKTWPIGSSSSKFDTVLKPYEVADLVWYLVTPAMGKASFDGPESNKEIKLKFDETNLISNFFSKKGANSEQESKPQVGSMHKVPIKINKPKRLKEEFETEDKMDCPSLTEESNDESKPNVSTSLE